MRTLLLLIAVLLTAPALAQDRSAAAGCEAAISAAQHAEALPPGLLPAIAQVESGRFDPRAGRARPWPWTIDADGDGQMFETKAQAIAAVRELQARGVRSIDIGCLQVNLMHHPLAFASLDDAFDPATNAAYAARFLRTLFAESGSWPVATAAYHSRTPALGASYATLVMAVWHGGSAITAEELRAASRWHHGFAAPLPARHPFAPPPLPGAAPVQTAQTPDLAALPLLLSPTCRTVAAPAGWLLPTQAPLCGKSVFTTTAALRQALAERPVNQALLAPLRRW